MRTLRTRSTVAALGVGTVLFLTGCGDDDPAQDGGNGTEEDMTDDMTDDDMTDDMTDGDMTDDMTDDEMTDEG